MNDPPKFADRLVGFTISFVDWVVAGCPRRNPDEVWEIFHTHCRPCLNYDPEYRLFPRSPFYGRTGGCTVCGCHVSANADDIMNKITQLTAECPLPEPEKKWRRCVDFDA